MINSKDFPQVSTEFSNLVNKLSNTRRVIQQDYRNACVREGREKIAVMLKEIQPLRDRPADSGDLSIFYIVQDSLFLLDAILDEFEKTISKP